MRLWEASARVSFGSSGSSHFALESIVPTHKNSDQKGRLDEME
jgi:hypothetical protein